MSQSSQQNHVTEIQPSPWSRFQLGLEARRCRFRLTGGSGASGSRGPSSNRRHHWVIGKHKVIINWTVSSTGFFQWMEKNLTGITHTHTQWTSTKIIWFICLRCKQHQPWPRSTVEITKVGARSWRFRSSLCNGPQFGGKGEFLFFKHIPSRSQSIHVNIYMCTIYICIYVHTSILLQHNSSLFLYVLFLFCSFVVVTSNFIQHFSNVGDQTHRASVALRRTFLWACKLVQSIHYILNMVLYTQKKIYIYSIYIIIYHINNGNLIEQL